MLEVVPARVVEPEWAVRVVSPTADAMSPAQRHDYMNAHPDSFLHVTRSVAGGKGDGTPEELAARNAAQLQRLLSSGAYGPHTPSLYLYRLDTGEHVQTALIAEVPLDAYDSGLVRPHERTRTDREDQLALHLRAVGATSSPVAMAYRPVPGLPTLLEVAQRTEPLLDFVGNGNLRQTVWQVPVSITDEIITTFGDHPLYVTDGHHRLASAARYRDEIERRRPGLPGSHHLVLSALFPADELRTIPFHRIVRTDLSADALVAALRSVAELTPVDDAAAATPLHAGAFGMYHKGRWWRLDPHDTDIALDTVWLQRVVLAELIGIVSPTTDPNLGHLPASAGTTELVARCDSTGAVAFVLAATPTEAIMDAADRDEILPPKSSYFTPKPRSGIFVVPRRIDD